MENTKEQKQNTSYLTELENFIDWEPTMATAEEFATKYIKFLNEKGITVRGGIRISKKWMQQQREELENKVKDKKPTRKKSSRKRIRTSEPNDRIPQKRGRY